jgi:hypothetical protein
MAGKSPGLARRSPQLIFSLRSNTKASVTEAFFVSRAQARNGTRKAALVRWHER